MSFDSLDDLNWLAVVVATAVYYALAAPWFADPVFGRAWRQSIGWERQAGERLGGLYYLGPLPIMGGYHIVGLAMASLLIAVW